MKAFSIKWADIKESSYSLQSHANEFINEYNPLIKYLDKLTIDLSSGMLAHFRVEHMISKDYENL